jgi:microcystin-dependent protein
MDEFIAIIKIFGGNFAPRGWQLCAGQTMAISQYSAVFALVGTTYGGNGQTTFNLPDLRGRVAIGMGNGPGLTPRVLGEMSGSESATGIGQTQFAIQVPNLPAHTHVIQGSASVAVADQEGTIALAASNVLGRKALEVGPPISALEVYVPIADAKFTQNNKLGGVSHNITAATTGNGAPISAPVSVQVNNMQPYLVVNYIFCMEGVFPSRN